MDADGSKGPVYIFFQTTDGQLAPPEQPSELRLGPFQAVEWYGGTLIACERSGHLRHVATQDEVEGEEGPYQVMRMLPESEQPGSMAFGNVVITGHSSLPLPPDGKPEEEARPGGPSRG